MKVRHKIKRGWDMSGPDFLIHGSEDSVGVVVVESVAKGAVLSGLSMETGAALTITACDDIPLGHKIAVMPISNGDTILKYGHDIGKAIADIPLGGHAHVQNVKTKRW
jgi:(2R)-sulfolactate sulfo-lyase subunit alpha|tara:strand:- start:4228 stop:4551 length:324 start_codon:yes stop_codon:yes gene_type:complete